VVLYILKRTLSAITVIFMTLLVSFFLFFAAKGDPVGVVCGPKCTPERAATIAHGLGLDRPVLTQFAEYAKGIVVGRQISLGDVTIDCPAPCLGTSYKLGQPVTKLIVQGLPVTLSIVLGSAAIYLLVGVVAGVFTARRRGTSLDRAVVGTTLIMGAVPYFVLALIIVLYVAGVFLPSSTYVPITENPIAWAGGLLAAWVTLGLVNSAAYTRYSRASMIEALGEDFVRTARAKGIGEGRVIYRHALRSALGPVTTIFGMDLAGQLTGAIFTERIFGLPGLGYVTLNAFGNYDLPVIMGSILFGAALLVSFNFIVDILYTVLDPRVRLG